MKRVLVLAICLLMVGVGVSQAQKEQIDAKIAPATSAPHIGDSRAVFEGFEVSVPPAGWTLVSNNPFTWYQSTVSFYEGSASAECDYDETYTGPQDEFLYMPPQAITAAEHHLNFAMMGSYYWSTAPYANYDMYVEVEGVRIWTWTASRNPSGANWVWELFDIDLSAYIGQTINIGFEYAGYDGAQGNVDAVGVNGGYVAPSAACCDAAGACTVVQAVDCLPPSIWHSEWAACSPNNCPIPPPNDTCAGAIQIPCGPFSISGNTSMAINDYSPTNSCTGYSAAGPDVVYYVDLVAGDTFSVTMSTEGLWDDSIYLLSDCANMNSCVAGADLYPDMSTFTYTVPVGGNGRYYLVVDGYGSGSGAFTITGDAGCTTPPVPVERTSWGAIKTQFR
jgi:hypothetical protein